MRPRGVFLALILLAGVLRFSGLAARPMHADEAVHADKFGTLLEGGGYTYDPSDYHGPSLYYLTLPSAWLQGLRRYVELDEITLRAVPAALGVALVAAHVGARAFLGLSGAVVAALLAAISPAMVFYSRYYIHETPLVLFSFCALVAACAYLGRPGAVPALLTGASVGLMLATKETAPLALGSVLGALALTWALGRWRGQAQPAARLVVRGRHVLLALLAALLVSCLLFSSFLSHPMGIVDSLRAYALYADRAGGASQHVHPWDYYLRLLVHFPATGTPFWSEGLILGLAIVGAISAWRTGGAPGADARVLRFLSLYALLMLVLYSSIPYKTPWCLLGFLHGMILLAGPGAIVLVRALRGAGRALGGALLVVLAAHLGWQAWAASFRLASDPRNPYVYAHTGNDVFLIAGRLADLARAHPDGLATPVQVIGREGLWPLPWYLRRFTRVAWWNGVSDAAPAAPVILATAEMEAALTRKLYDVPPPGERQLYVRIFERPVELRPQLELRGYATARLWDEYRRRAGGSAPQPSR